MSEDNKQAERNKQIDEALGMAKPTAAPDAPVNDLSGLVKKRKAPALTDTAPAASSCAPSLPKLGSTDQNASALTNSKGEQTEEGESATKKQKTET